MFKETPLYHHDHTALDLQNFGVAHREAPPETGTAGMQVHVEPALLLRPPEGRAAQPSYMDEMLPVADGATTAEEVPADVEHVAATSERTGAAVAEPEAVDRGRHRHGPDDTNAAQSSGGRGSEREREDVPEGPRGGSEAGPPLPPGPPEHPVPAAGGEDEPERTPIIGWPMRVAEGVGEFPFTVEVAGPFGEAPQGLVTSREVDLDGQQRIRDLADKYAQRGFQRERTERTDLPAHIHFTPLPGRRDLAVYTPQDQTTEERYYAGWARSMAIEGVPHQNQREGQGDGMWTPIPGSEDPASREMLYRASLPGDRSLFAREYDPAHLRSLGVLDDSEVSPNGFAEIFDHPEIAQIMASPEIHREVQFKGFLGLHALPPLVAQRGGEVEAVYYPWPEGAETVYDRRGIPDWVSYYEPHLSNLTHAIRQIAREQGFPLMRLSPDQVLTVPRQYGYELYVFGLDKYRRRSRPIRANEQR